MAGASTTLAPGQMQALESLMTKGIASAADGLAGMVGGQITLAPPKIKLLPILSASTEIAPPETVLAGIYLVISGSLNAHVLLVLPLENAMNVVDLVMGEPIGTTTELGEIEVSALGEVGNIITSFFVTVIGDVSHEIVQISPPAVMSDMLQAMMDAVLGEVGLTSDEVLVIETAFLQGDRSVKAMLLMPDLPGLLGILEMMAQ
jgi:chemotaxis protein CheC